MSCTRSRALGLPTQSAEHLAQPASCPPVQPGDTSWLEVDNGFSEDCLNLKVWAPEDVGDQPLPVNVYIYGGGFERGANTQTTSNASGLAAIGRAIGVSPNYRLARQPRRASHRDRLPDIRRRHLALRKRRHLSLHFTGSGAQRLRSGRQCPHGRSWCSHGHAIPRLRNQRMEPFDGSAEGDTEG